jgi:hypothetical protein
MKKIIFTICLIPLLAFSQNYQTINPEVVSYFEPEESFEIPIYVKDSPIPIRCIGIINQNTIAEGTLYTNHYELQDSNYLTIHYLAEYCAQVEMPSWIGGNIFVKNDGYNVFFNRDHDSLFINTTGQQADSWTFYTYENNSYFLATIDQINTMNFLGISDTIKIISLQYYNADNTPESSPLNENEIWISKNHGFVKVINFRDFPEFSCESYQVLEHNLVGQTGLTEEYHALTKGDIWNFDIEDEYHFKMDYHLSSGGWSGNWNQWVIKKVLNKFEYGIDSIVYVIDQNHWGKQTPPNLNYFHTHDTIEVTYTNLSEYISPALPFEPYSAENYCFTYGIISLDKFDQRPRIINGGGTYCTDISGECYYGGFSYNNSSTEYIKGCGSAFSSFAFEPTSYQNTSQSNLVYFNKDDETWGTPIELPIDQFNPINSLQFNHWYICPNNYFDLHWESPNPSFDTLMGFNIYRNSDLYIFQTENNLYHTENGWNCGDDFVVYDGGNFWIHVTAVYNSTLDESAYIDSVHCEGFLIDVKENLNLRQVSISPNPATNTISINNPSDIKIISVTLYTQTGLKILSFKAPIGNIDISDLKPGLYFVEIKTSEGGIMKKIIVQ